MPTARTKVLTWEVSGSLYSEDSKERNMLWGRPRLCSQTAGLDISLSSLTSTTLGSSLYACVSLPEKILRKPTSCMLSHFSHVRLIVTLWIVAHRLLCPWNSPGKNTGEGCHALLPGIFLTQGLSPHLLCLLCWKMDSLPLVPPGKPTW